MQTCFQTLVGLEPEIDNNFISEWTDRVMNECSNEKQFCRSQGSHFSGLTKFHDISMIFPGFLVNFQVFFHYF